MTERLRLRTLQVPGLRSRIFAHVGKGHGPVPGNRYHDSGRALRTS